MLTVSNRMLPVTRAYSVSPETRVENAAQSNEGRDVWNSLTVGQAVRGDTSRRGESIR